jgi:hypothetical protein
LASLKLIQQFTANAEFNGLSAEIFPALVKRELPILVCFGFVVFGLPPGRRLAMVFIDSIDTSSPAKQK